MTACTAKTVPLEIVVDLGNELLIELPEPFTHKYRSGHEFTTQYWLVKLHYIERLDYWALYFNPSNESGDNLYFYPIEMHHFLQAVVESLALHFTPKLNWWIDQLGS